MVAPTVKEVTSPVAGNAQRVGGIDWNQLIEIIKGTHATERIPGGAIEDQSITALQIGPDEVGDSEIVAHTSTKITITAKGQLNAQIGYKDETDWLTNAMVATGVFAKITGLGTQSQDLDMGNQDIINAVISDFSNNVLADGTHLQIRNESGGAYVKGDVVHISGFSIGQGLPLTVKADASAAATMPAIGIVNEAIANNASGQICITGRMDTLNTSAFTEGDVLYVSETAGAFTNVKPTGTALIQNIATVLRSHTSLGEIQIISINRSNDLPNIADANLWVGNASAVPTAVVISGDATMINTGALTIANDAIDDAKIAAHTSTKITITAKGQLNAAIVYTDQTNTFGDFAQIFPDNQLFIQNPAATFEYQIIGAAIVADRILNLPLLTGTDTLVTEAHPQPLTNKTIDGDLNTIIDINETQMDVSVGAANTVLTSNGVGSAPTYQTSPALWTVLGDYEASIAEGTISFTFTAVDFDDDAYLLLVIDLAPTASFNLLVSVNNVKTANYSSDGRRITGGVETLLDINTAAGWQVASSTLVDDSGANIFGIVEIGLTKGAANDQPMFNCRFQSVGAKNEVLGGMRNTDATSISRVDIDTSTSTWRIGTRMTLYKVARA